MRTKNEVLNKILELNKTRFSYLEQAEFLKGTKAGQAYTDLAFGLEPIICNLCWVIGMSNEDVFTCHCVSDRMAGANLH